MFTIWTMRSVILMQLPMKKFLIYFLFCSNENKEISCRFRKKWHTYLGSKVAKCTCALASFGNFGLRCTINYSKLFPLTYLLYAFHSPVSGAIFPQWLVLFIFAPVQKISSFFHGQTYTPHKINNWHKKIL